MGTTLSDVMDLFLSSIADYKLDTIYSSSGSNVLNQYCEPWLLRGIDQFYTTCSQSLTYTPISGSADGEFAETLTMENQLILSDFMGLFWLQKGIQDLRSLNNFIQDRDFKSFSPAQNITARTANYNSKREELSQRLVSYGLRHNVDWNSWNNQIFNS